MKTQLQNITNTKTFKSSLFSQWVCVFSFLRSVINVHGTKTALSYNNLLSAKKTNRSLLKRALYGVMIPVFVLAANFSNATTYFLTAAGAANAQTVASWNTIAAGGGTAAPNFTTAGDIFNIPANITGTVAANWTFGNASTASSITLTVDGTLQFTSGFSLTLTQTGAGVNTMNINGTIIFLSTATNGIQLKGAGTASGNVVNLNSGAILKTSNLAGISGTTTGSISTSLLTLSLSTSANYEFTYNAASTAQPTTGLPATVNNLTISGSTSPKTINGSITINGTLTTNTSCTLDFGTNTLALGVNAVITNGGTIKTSVPTATSATPIPSGKTWGGTIQYAAAAGAQTIVSGTYNNLTLSNTSLTNTAGGNLTVDGTLVTTSGGTLDMGTANILGGTLGTITNAGTIKTSVPTATSATPIAIGKTWGGTVQYAATTGAQTIVSGTYTSLTLSNTSGTNTAGGNLTATTLTTTAGGTLDMGTSTLSVSGTPSHAGTLQTQNTSSTPLTTGKTWGGTVEYNAATGGQTVMAGTYSTLTLSNTSGTQTASGAVAATTLNTSAGGTFDMVTSALSGLTTVTNSGTIKTQNITATPITTGLTWGGTVQYDATTGAQTVMAGTYNNLNSGGTSGTNTISGNITVSGTLTIASGSSFSFGATLRTFTLSGTGANTLVNNGTLLLNGGTGALAHVFKIAASSIATFGTLTPGTGSKVEYTATAGSQVINASVTYNHLQIDNTSGTNTVSGDLTINGILTTTAGGTLDMGTSALSAIGTPAHAGILKTQNTSSTPLTTGKTWGGTVEYNAATGGQTVMAGTYSNLTLSNTSNTNTASGTLTVNGVLTTTSGGILDMGTTALLAGTLTTITNNGTIITSVPTATSTVAIATGKTWGGTVQYAAAAGSQTVVPGTYNNLSLGGTSGTNTLTNGDITVGGVLNIATGTSFNFGATATVHNVILTGTGPNTLVNNGTMLMNGTGAVAHVLKIAASSIAAFGTLTTGTGSKVEYTATAGSQVINASVTYNHLQIDNTSGTNTVSGDLTINGILTTTAGGTLDMGTSTLSVTGAPAHAGILQTQNTSSTPLTTGKTWGGTVEYNAASGGQTIMAGTYSNLTLSNTSNTNTASGTLTVNGVLTTTSGGTLDMGTTALLAGTLTTITNNGTIKTSVPTTTSATPIVASKTWGGTIEYAASAGAQTIVAGTYNNLKLSNTSGTDAAGGTLTVNGVLTTTSGGTLDMGTTALLAGTLSTITNNGTIKTSVPTATSTVAIATGKTWGGTGTVQYAAATGSQTVVPGTYNNLSLGGASGTNTLTNGDITVGGVLTIATGTSFNFGATATVHNVILTGTGTNTLVNNGTMLMNGTGAVAHVLKIAASSIATFGTVTTGTGSTVELNGTSAQTIPAFTFNNLTIANSNGVSLTADITVNGTLTFSSGIVTTSANKVILASAATVSGAGAGKYIFGTLRRNIPATLNFSAGFNIGDATNFTPVTLLFSGTPGGTGSIDISTSVGAPALASGISQIKYVNRFWTITNNSVAGFTSYAPTFTFVAGDIQGSASTASFAIKRLSGGTWSPTTTGTLTSTSSQATGLSTTSFGDFYIGEAPVATKLVVTGSASQTAGTTQNLTITAQDANGNTITSYTGDKSLTFSGANSSSSPVTTPKVTDKTGSAIAFGTATTITF
ncbi:MAG: Mucin-22, partial [Chitinophagaceae bacterium]|nr:Mucin-22 [Chitinophagaceae bacterium]